MHLFGTERVAWRGEDGESHVWHNRCIHRGMRLSYGFVDGNRLACRYHGWRFGGDGKCGYIPAHPDMTPPEDFCVPASPSAETSGLIWTSLGAPNDAPPDLSEFPELTFCRSVAVNCAAGDVTEQIEKAALPPFTESESTVSARVIGPGITTIEASSGDILVIALQPVDDTKTNLHVLARSKTDEESETDLRLRISAWARQFRQLLENPATAASTA